VLVSNDSKRRPPDAALDVHDAPVLAGDAVLAAAPPPLVDVLGEGAERHRGRDAHEHRDARPVVRARAHGRLSAPYLLSTCALKEPS
jgi:hypothetical protein